MFRKLSYKILVSVLFSSVGFADSNSSLVTTTGGPVQGTELNDTISFKAIPYAKSPVGELRWAPPVAAEPWTETFRATHFRSACPQLSMSNVLVIDGEEDCLSLNVWRPANAEAKNLPVMVFIHGGANMSGAANVSVLGKYLYDGTKLAAEKDVVVVTIQYRIGALGFLSHPALSKESGHGSGNYATMDQILALQWLQKNISKFAGDPANVTIFGQSAGAASVLTLLASPVARGLFAKAIVQSGYLNELPLKESEKLGGAMASELGCDGEDAKTLQCLRRLSPELLVRYNPHPETVASYLATVDGNILPLGVLETFRTGKAAAVPVMIGTTADEMTMLAPLFAESSKIFTESDYEKGVAKYMGDEVAPKVLKRYPVMNLTPRATYEKMLGDGMFQCSSRRLAKAIAATGGKAYMYVFTHVSDNPWVAKYGAFHGADLPFVFNTLSKTEAEATLANKMGDFWTSFAKNGKPVARNSAAWSIFKSDEFMELNVKPQAKHGYREDFCDFWDQTPFPGSSR